MERLYKGIHKFKKSFFRKNEKSYKRLSKGQNPDALFITCSDSRVDPCLVTQSKPGELFIVRNVGNIIPPYNAIKDKNSVAAAIEFAVLVLNVKDIIVCGHSKCGAMLELHHEDGRDDMPHLKDWLKIASPVKEAVDRLYSNSPQKSKIATILEKENVLAQLKNIQTYPFVAEALKKGAVHLQGWYYNIATGDIYAYNPETDVFEKIVYKK